MIYDLYIMSHYHGRLLEELGEGRLHVGAWGYVHIEDIHTARTLTRPGVGTSKEMLYISETSGWYTVWAAVSPPPSTHTQKFMLFYVDVIYAYATES